jgi:glycosyltransferase involved in cell wall biosynthesis
MEESIRNLNMVSIIMPVYNTPSSWLEQSIISCLNQTYQNFELLIIDNESTDEKTIKCLYRFKNIDKIKMLHSPKQDGKRGVSTSLNEGIKNSKGDYIARMDSDDWMHPDRLEKQIQYLENNKDIHIVGSQMKIIQQNTITSHPEIIDIDTIVKYNVGWFMNHPTVMFRKQLFDIVGLYAETPKNFPEDFELWTRCLAQGIKIRNMKDCLLNYNFHGTNTSIVDANTKEWSDSMVEYKKRLI